MKRAHFFASLCALSSLAGCDCGAGPATGDAGPSDAASVEDASIGADALLDAHRPDGLSSSCVREPARMAAAGDCLGDDDCPCGTFCDLGACVSACLSDAECGAGERCDAFGRCRDEDHEAIVPAPEPTGSAADVEVEPVATIADGETETVVRLVVHDAESRVRVTGRYGAELECTPGAGFTTECDLGVVAADTHVAVTARREPDMPDEGAAEVHVYSDDGGHSTVTVLRADQRVGSVLAGPEGGGGPVPQPIAGTYRGLVRLDTHGLSPDTVGLPALVELPVTAEIWGAAPGAVTFRIDDPYHALASDGVVVGTATLTTDDATLEGPVSVPTQPYASGALAPADTWSLIAEWQSAEMVTTPLGGEVTIGVHAELSGAALRPFVDLNVTLSRTGEPSGAATPAAEPPATVGYTESSRAASPSSWETAIDARFPTYASLSATQRMERYQFLLGEYAPDACAGLDAANPLDAVRAFYGMSHGGAAWRAERGLVFELLDIVDVPDEDLDFGTVALPYDASATLGGAAPQGVLCAGTARISLRSAPLPDRLLGVEPFDHCAELAARTGCTILDSAATRSTATLAITGTYRALPAGPFVALAPTDRLIVETYGPAGGRVPVCVLPAEPAFCAEVASCVEPAAGSTHASVVGSVLGTATIPSGDVRCAAGARTAGIDLDARAATTTVTASQSVETCISELERLRAVPALSGTFGDGLRSAFVTSSCVDSARLLHAMGHGLDTPVLGVPGDRAQAYGARLLVRWLDLHANIAHEATQRSALFDLVRETGAMPPIVDADAALRASLGVWDLLFQPTFGARLDRLDGNVLAEPDYRAGTAGVVVRAADEQSRGLPLVIVETASRQLRLLHAILENDWLEGGAPPDRSRLEAIVPRIVAARALAAGLAGRAGVTVSSADTVAWGRRYIDASGTLTGDLQRVIDLVERAHAGQNPLGIDDADLPLYFLDDATGPGGRFAAVSDFLIGTGPGSTAWVPSLVASTEAAESAARAAYLDEIDRETRAAEASASHARWVSDVRSGYDAQLRAYCGTTGSGLVDDPSFVALACALDDDPICQDADTAFDSWTLDDFLGRMCVAYAHSERYLLSREGRTTPVFDDGSGRPTHPRERRLAPSPPYGSTFQLFAIDCYWRGGETRIARRPCPDGGGECLFCESGLLDPELPDARDHVPVSQATLAYLGRLDAAHFADLQSCQGVHPEMRESVPEHESRFEIPGCAHGAIGDAIAAVAQADDDVELARAEAAEHMEAYDIAMRSCLILEEANAAIIEANDAHLANMTELVDARADVESSAAVLGATSDCLSTMAGVAGTVEGGGMSPMGAATSAGADFLALGLGIASCATGAIAGSLEAEAAQLQGQIDTAEVAHDTLVDNLAAAAETDICFNDARLELVGSRAAAVRIRSAATVRARAVERLGDLLAEVQRVHDEGYEYLREVEAARVTHPAGEAWADPAVRAFTERFRLARRAAYLAVRAVENEFQASLSARQDVLAADTSADLESVLRTLWTTAGTRSIGGSRPSDLHVVLSLRDDILRLADESRAPEGLHGLTPVERLRVMLSDQRFAVRDASGRLAGLQIPFTLAPLGALGFATGGVAIYSTTDCAERVWSVNASILGAEVWTGSDTTFARIDLLKQNTFFSQWCGAAPAGEPFQVASVRPSNNLFLEPGVSGGIVGPFGTGETELFARARMQAFFGVSRAELEDPRYANGETSELAARGLFGQYALFIPADLVSRESSSGARSDGLVLDRIEDILLRVDYVSVAR